MTIKEMETQIDDLNLDKLEVKMKKGGQVHYFVCGDPESYSENKDTAYGNLIVFDENGKAWSLPGQKWKKGDSFRVFDSLNEKGKVVVAINYECMEELPSLNLEARL